MTFSIVARSEDRSQFGLAVCSSSPAVAARCGHARAGVGAVATQNLTDPSLGPAVLAELSQDTTAADALTRALARTPYAAWRQLLVIGASGPPALHSGAHTLGVHASASGPNAAAAGNLLARASVPQAMLDAFARARGALPVALLDALRAGLTAGGEAGAVHSAGLLVVREVPWPIIDLRVDWHDTNPVGELERVWHIYAPQLEDYITRAVDPPRAPGFRP
jgi:uncharacterized Ntn-hydrolase superfamily protein